MADKDKSANLVLEDQPESPTDEKNDLGEPTPEELEFRKLKGSSQERFSSLLGQRNQALAEKESAVNRVNELEARNKLLEGQTLTSPAPETPAFTGQMTPEQQQAVENLRKFGIVTQGDLQALQDQLILDAEYQRLETMYGGKGGGPSFDRVEIEEYMKTTGIYNPQKAFEDLYREELFDLRKKSEEREEPSRQVYTEKPSGSGMGKTEPLTVDSLRERLSRPDGMQWWDKNRERILPLMGQLIQ